MIGALLCNTPRAELIENAVMVDPIKGSTELNLHEILVCCKDKLSIFETTSTILTVGRLSL